MMPELDTKELNQYRFLEVGEKIKKGDLWWCEEKLEWKKVLYPNDTTKWTKNHIIRKKEGSKNA